jgi:putative sterol carrier protein
MDNQEKTEETIKNGQEKTEEAIKYGQSRELQYCVYKRKKETKNTTHDVLDTTMWKQTQIS